ncbi:MAG: InlB B-repeat-containing protein [Bacilli bacterium]|nr:InlB B-repeat-containing protein [Bacilli bacterium]
MRSFLKFVQFIFYISIIAVIVFFSVRYFNYYKVTFVVEDTAYDKLVKKGDILKELETPEKEGYTFLYWMEDSTIIDDEYEVNYDAVLIAIFEKNLEIETCYVTFDSDGGSTIDGQSINKGTSAIEPTIPTKDGYIFKEWQLDGEKYDFNKPIDSNIVLKASYVKKNTKAYVVTFNTFGGSKIANKYVNADGRVEKPTDPFRDGYIFKEWRLNGKTFDFNSVVTSDITLNAAYGIDNREIYIVRFNTKGGSTVKEQYIRSGDKVTVPKVPTKSGYKFSNWIYNDNIYNFNTPVTSNMTLNSVYVKNTNNTQSANKIIREYKSDTLKYWVENKGTYAITHIWVKDAYNQFKTGVKEPFPQLGVSNSIMNYVSKAKNYKDKEMIGINGSGIVSSAFFANVAKAVPKWKNSSISPAVMVDGEVKRNFTNISFPNLGVYTYGLKKDGYLNYYNLSHYNNITANESEFNRMIKDGVKYTFAFYPVLIHKGIMNKNLQHDNNIRQALGQIDKNNFIIITTTTTNRSKGLSRASLATMMKELGCIEAYNLDGGGSTSLIYKPKGTNTSKSIVYTSRSVADIVYFVE